MFSEISLLDSSHCLMFVVLQLQPGLEMRPCPASAKCRMDHPQLELGGVKIGSRGFHLLQCCAFPLPCHQPVDKSIPVKMSPSNTPASMAATSQDIEMLLAAQVRATAPV